MNIPIQERLIHILNTFEEIKNSDTFTKETTKETTKKKRKYKKLKQEKENKKDIIENISLINKEEPEIINKGSQLRVNYHDEYNIVYQGSQIYLPENPIPKKNIRIINLGTSLLQIIPKNENEKIYHPFYSPKGSQHLFLEQHNFIDIFYILKENGEQIWLSK